MPRSGHFTEGFGAFKCRQTGRYFVAMVDDRGFAPDPPEPLSWHRTWWSAVEEADRQGKAHAPEHAAMMELAGAIAEHLRQEARRVKKGSWPEIRVMSVPAAPSSDGP